MASVKIIELTDDNICKICENALGKYSCPRCNVHYCSLSCYQSEKHQQCSEAFYKECVYEDLKFQEEDADSKTKMMEILKRVHENNALHVNEEIAEEGEAEEELDSDDEIYIDLGERLEDVDLDDAEKVWERLTSDERQEFESFIRSGDITNLIEKWEPWWLYRNENKVLDLEEEMKFKQECPNIKENIQSFSSLCSKPAASCVKNNLINVIASYAFVTRYFNGEYLNFAHETASTIVFLSLTLREGHNFEDADRAIVSVHQECLNSDWVTIDQENINIMKEDVQKIMAGPTPTLANFYILCALSDLHGLLTLALETPKENKKTKFTEKFSDYEMPSAKMVPKSELKKHVKKVEFFLSYVKDCLDI